MVTKEYPEQQLAWISATSTVTCVSLTPNAAKYFKRAGCAPITKPSAVALGLKSRCVSPSKSEPTRRG
jgi:hypothetical protein